MKINFINLQAQYQAYKSHIDQQIQNVLNHSNYIMGEEVELLEQELQEFCQAKEVICCSNGTDALLLVLMAIGVKQGDEVITSPFTFFASAEAIAFLGAKPVFVDIDEKTYNLNPHLICEKITSKTKAILPISLFGQPSEMDTINEIAKQFHCVVVEDAAQSFGATYKGKKSCNLSDFATTSFFPSKPLGCYGDGGAVFCQDSQSAEKIRSLLKHGQSRRYEHRYIGMNARLDTIQAGILRAKLPFLQEELNQREAIASYYSANLKKAITPFIPPYISSAFAQYSIRVKERQEVIAKLQKAGIPTAVHYPKPLHLQEAFAYLGYVKGDFPISEKVAQEILSLPMSAFLTPQEQDYIIENFNQIISG